MVILVNKNPKKNIKQAILSIICVKIVGNSKKSTIFAVAKFENT